MASAVAVVVVVFIAAVHVFLLEVSGPDLFVVFGFRTATALSEWQFFLYFFPTDYRIF